jgi:hypothetical protein
VAGGAGAVVCGATRARRYDTTSSSPPASHVAHAIFKGVENAFRTSSSSAIALSIDNVRNYGTQVKALAAESE